MERRASVHSVLSSNIVSRLKPAPAFSFLDKDVHQYFTDPLFLHKESKHKETKWVVDSQQVPEGGGVMLVPASLDFGRLKQGCCYAMNVFVDMVAGLNEASYIDVPQPLNKNITIVPVSNSAPYRLEVQIYAARQETIDERLTFRTVTQTVVLPLTGCVVDPHVFERERQANMRMSIAQGKSLGRQSVRLISSLAPLGVVRPRALKLPFPSCVSAPTPSSTVDELADVGDTVTDIVDGDEIWDEDTHSAALQSVSDLSGGRTSHASRLSAQSRTSYPELTLSGHARDAIEQSELKHRATMQAWALQDSQFAEYVHEIDNDVRGSNI